ncbi:lactonase family protein [Arthrobacter citreus]|nr:lactonase family protein [Arthrobacter citreus]
MNSNQKFVGYVGTYTKSESKGVYQFTLDTEKERITDVKPVAELGNPTYLAISEDNKNLYAVVKEGNLGGISVFAINENGELQKLNDQLIEGASPCHISVDSKKQNIVTANYHKGTIELYKIDEENGFASVAKSVMQHEGTGPNKERQEKPHAHYSGYTLNEKYVAAIDLGIDQLVTYKIEDNSLVEVSSLSVKPGSGPRHITFHPNGKFAYIMTELSSEVIALQFNEENGSFTELQYISTIPSDFTENNQGSAIHISKDGQFVYAGNRGHNSIAVFSVNQDTGKLELVEITSSEGNWPRDFVLDPSENYLVGSNEMSGTLVLYSRNNTTGRLTAIQTDVQVPEAVCVKFLNA